MSRPSFALRLALSAPLALLLAAPANAAPQLLWSYDSFGETVSPAGGWMGGYSPDRWGGFTYMGHTWAYPLTDEGDGDWLDDASISNWMTNEAAVVYDGEFEWTTYVSDNDAIGGVIGQGTDEVWMVLMCGPDSDSSCPLPDHAGDVVLLDITARGAREIAVAHDTYPSRTPFDMHISVNDGTITAWSDDTGWAVSGAITDGTSMSRVGFYAFNCGGIQDGVAGSAFGLPMVYGLDDDDDDIIDDVDNCEFVLNADQSDNDNDGIGDACDESSGDADTDSDTDTDTDTDSDTDTDTDSDADADTDSGNTDSGALDTGDFSLVKTPGSCGCATSPESGLASLFVAMGAVLSSRRRR